MEIVYKRIENNQLRIYNYYVEENFLRAKQYIMSKGI